MAKLRFGVLFVWVCMIIIILISSNIISASMGDDSEEQRKKQSFWEWQRLRDSYSLYSALFTTSVGQYWGLFKALVSQTYTHFFPPNLDFRRAGGGDEGEGGEKVKEAIAKSLGTSKATVEDAAKSAADIAGQTLNKARDTVKKTFSAHTNNDIKQQQQNEL